MVRCPAAPTSWSPAEARRWGRVRPGGIGAPALECFPESVSDLVEDPLIVVEGVQAVVQHRVKVLDDKPPARPERRDQPRDNGVPGRQPGQDQPGMDQVELALG